MDASAEQLKRIADAMEEILRLVKKDMQRHEERADGQAMNAFGD